MAKNADKKHAANAKYWSDIMLLALIVVNAMYFMRVLSDIKSRDFEWYYSDVIWLIVYVWIERKTY